MNTYYKILYKTLLPISLVPMISLLFFITASNNFVYALVMRGTQGNDNFSGTPIDDSMVGLRGNDNMARIEGNDAIEGSQGNDILKGSEGNEYLNGGKITICSMLMLEMMN
jgi:Ca2+-binding RTX toxin-like protein